MYKIVKKQELTTNIYLMEVEANRVAKTCEPGQFVIVRMDSESERIPLTICDYNREKGTVTIVFQTVGAGTKLMAQLSEGEYFHDFVGPLGCPSELVEQPLDEVKAKKILFVAAKGLSGEAYKGHTFWDTEMFILPYFIYSAPEIARSLEEYRFLGLTGAHKKAAAHHYEGAQFPYESTYCRHRLSPDWRLSGFSCRNSRSPSDLRRSLHITASLQTALL